VMLHYPCIATPLGLQAVEVLRFAPSHGTTVDRSPKETAGYWSRIIFRSKWKPARP
jgi:hypothetical protein